MPTRHLVLYLDCEPRTFSQGVLLLKAHGHSVIASMDADTALRILAVEPVTLVIVCDSLEAGTRESAVRGMREIRPGIPIVLLAKQGEQQRQATSLYDMVLAADDQHRVRALLRNFTGLPEE